MGGIRLGHQARFFLWAEHGALILAPVLAVSIVGNPLLLFHPLYSDIVGWLAYTFVQLLAIWQLVAATRLIVRTVRLDRRLGFLYLGIILLVSAYAAIFVGAEFVDSPRSAADVLSLSLPAVIIYIATLVSLSFARSAAWVLCCALPFPIALLVTFHMMQQGGCMPFFIRVVQLPWILLALTGLAAFVATLVGRAWIAERVRPFEMLRALLVVIPIGAIALFVFTGLATFNGSCEGPHKTNLLHNLIGPFWI